VRVNTTHIQINAHDLNRTIIDTIILSQLEESSQKTLEVSHLTTPGTTTDVTSPVINGTPSWEVLLLLLALSVMIPLKQKKKKT
jgi:hypothetical protein